jgi:UPF0176 protein
MSIVNITAYRFMALSRQELPVYQNQLKTLAQTHALKGTILLSEEGINLNLSGLAENIKAYQCALNETAVFAELTYKESISEKPPFSRLLVRIKKEIIQMGCDNIQPVNETAPYLSPEKLKAWYQQGRDMVILDTRNTYEVALGTFAQAIDLNLETFREFPQAIENLPDSMKEKPIVTFCTGGIRCEKAAVLLQQKGFQEVYQLEGGILNYFAQCGGEYFNGECFVFDDRVAVSTQLKETYTRLCKKCGSALTAKQADQDCRCYIFPSNPNSHDSHHQNA